MKRRIALIAIAAVLLLVGGIATWLLCTQSGLRFAVARAEGFLAPKLAVDAIEGSVSSRIRLRGVRWHDPENGIDVSLATGDLELGLHALLSGGIHVEHADLQGLTVQLSPAPPKPPEPSTRAPLDPPVELRIDDFRLRDARVSNADGELVHVRDAGLAAAWTSAALVVSRLDVQADQGEAHFNGTAAGRDRYRGDGAGRFRWQVGQRRIAGTLNARASEAAADLTLQLTEPERVDATLALQQTDELPWRFTLQVPAYQADFQGAGTLDEARASGRLVLQGTPLEVRTLTARRAGDDVALNGELGFAGGNVRIDGTLQPKAMPLAGRFQVDWDDIAIPENLAGQKLQTAGRIEAHGSMEAYAADGTLKLGPPRRLANIEIHLAGTPQVVQLAQFDVVQPQGRLDAAGVLQLQPEIAWTVGAAARKFDPGAILSDWPGRLDFSLATDGSLEQSRVALENLKGTLRNRAIAGHAELTLDREKTLVGAADLSSGGSRVRIDASRDARDQARARADLSIASLADWLPGAKGSLNGRVEAQGRWPDLAVTTQLRAHGIDVAGTAVRDAQLDADITKPLEPSGHLSLDASGAAAAGFEFDTVRVRADGDAGSHRLKFDANGSRLTLGLDVAGGLREGAWRGTVSRLGIASDEVAHLALQAPFEVSASKDRATLGQACLADGAIRVCLEGDGGPLPAFHARYSVAALPLKLAQSFADLPVGLEGTLDGNGDVSRDAQGALSGDAHVRSASGRIVEIALDGQAPREFLAWRDLAVDATLRGENGEVAANARLNDQGRLDGRVAVAGLTGPSPQLDGHVTAQLPGLGVIEAFAPQLMNVQGQLALDTRVAGALDAPRIDGEARLEQVGFTLPLLNIKPHDGRVVARLTGEGPIQLEGSLQSGDGQLDFKGEAQRDGTAQVNVSGRNVLAADIPGVKVTLTPDLAVKRTATRTDLTGKLQIPSADIDLQRLPSAKKTRSASADVVVVDDPQASADAARSAPLNASVEVTLGDAVKIKGYGLDATVGGELSLRERPGEPTTASGELHVSGAYQAYGQDLKIQQGQLLYAGTPVDNPRLAIIAVREVDTVKAGFRVGGSARNPELTVFSDPAMGQANALAYIVAGKPLDQVGTGSGEGDALQSAARQLGTAAGGLLAKNVGKRLGVDEIGVKDSAAIGGAALTVGQYISPRLYLGYGVGLFDPGQVVTLRYRLSHSLSFEAEQGTLNSRAGITFRKEK